MANVNMEYKALNKFYVQQVMKQIVPFWKKALDAEHGGVFTGYDSLGRTLIHRDKFTWSQGRFLWLWSRMADMCRRGLIPDDEETYTRHADLTYRFIKEHAFLSNGNCIFLLTEAGEPKEMLPGQGHDISFYADCFVVMGCAEYARVTGNRDAWQTAAELYANIVRRLASGIVRSEPYPVPRNNEAHGYAMIMLNTSQALAYAAKGFGLTAAASDYSELAWGYAQRIMDIFCDQEFRIREVITSTSSQQQIANSMLLRHLNPGHTVESMWFVMEEAHRHGKSENVAKAVQALYRALEMGWDRQYGGIMRYVDLEGGQPKGSSTPEVTAFDKLIENTWDMKLWWPHSEGLYACLLAYELTGEGEMLEWYKRLHEYTFRTFPADEGEEWIQIRNRMGEPATQVVALPVKDPYHILRNMLLIIELTAQQAND